MPRTTALIAALLLVLGLAAPAVAEPEPSGLKPYQDPGKAFTVLVPHGWRTSGGVLNLTTKDTGGPLNAGQAKFSFWIFRPDKKLVVHFFPRWYYLDPTGQRHLEDFKVTTYQGATVTPVMTPGEFAKKVVFERLHKEAPVSEVKVVGEKDLPEAAQAAKRPQTATAAAQVSFTYLENGVRFLEMVSVVIERDQRAGSNLWFNPYTQAVRCPVEQAGQWLPLLGKLQRSFKVEPEWMIWQIKATLKSRVVNRPTDRQITRMAQEIIGRRAKVTEIIVRAQKPPAR